MLFTSISISVSAANYALNFDRTTTVNSGQDANNNYINIPSVVPLSNNMTVEAWIKVDSTSPSDQDIVAWGNNTSSGAVDVQFLRISGNKANIFWRNSQVSSSTAINTGEWTHIAISKSSNNVSIYINGSLDATGTLSSGTTIPTASALTIGITNVNNDVRDYLQFGGEIDEVRIWDSARSANEISSNYNKGLTGSESNLVAYYQFNEGSGSSASDSAGNYDGTLVGMTTSGAGSDWIASGAGDATPPVITSNSGGSTASINVAENTTTVTTVTATDTNSVTYSITGGTDQAKFSMSSGVLTFSAAPNYEVPTDSDSGNDYVVEVTAADSAGNTDTQTITVTVTDDTSTTNYALDFDGVNDYVLINSLAAYGSTFSQSAWIYPTDGTTGVYRNIMGYSSNGSVITRSPFIYQYGRKVHYGFGDGSSSQYSHLTTDDVLTINAWNHVSVTFDGTNYRLYINGILKDNYTGASGSTPPSNTVFKIGAEDNYFQGKIDEVRIWNDARTAEEIQDEMNNVLVGNEAGLVAYYKMDADSSSETKLLDITSNSYDGTLTNMTSADWVSTVSFDTTAPTAPTVSATTPTTDTTPTWSWTAGGGGNGNYRYKLDDSDLTSGSTATTSTSYTPGSALSDGSHTLYVQEFDGAGNWSSAGSKTVVVDTTAPTISSVTADWGNSLNQLEDNSNGTVTVATSGVEDGQTVTVTINSANYTANVSSNSASVAVTAAGLQALTNNTEYTITANVSDAAGNTATAHTSTTFTALNNPTANNALEFDGSNDYVSTSSVPYANSFSIEAWIKPDTLSNNAAYLDEIANWYHSSTNENVQFRIYQNNLELGMRGSENTWTAVTDDATIVTGAWQHVAATYDGSNGAVKLYLNGVLVESGSILHNASPKSFTLNQFVIGSYGEGGSVYTGATRSFDGQMDELRVWNDVRTASEISSNISSELGGNESNLVAYYKFNEPDTGTILSNSTTGDYDGTLTNMTGTEWTASSAFSSDVTAPTVSSVSSDKAAGSYKAGEVIDIDVNFSESVTVTGTPQITLETGSTDQVVNYSSGSGTSTLTFNYTVQAGDTSSDLDYASTSALALNSGTIKDSAGNNATLTLASPGAANSLRANEALVIDTTVPTITITATEVSDGGTSNDSTLSLTFTTSESTTNFASGDVSVSGGALSSFSGSGTSYTATFTPSSDGATTIDVAANGFTDTAGNNNTAATQFNWTYDGTAPSFSSSATANAAENQTTAIDIDASDTHTITYSISGGDSSLFSINSSTGVVTFSSAPDYELPGDSDTNNTYTFTATATDSLGNAGTQSVIITVTDVSDAQDFLVREQDSLSNYGTVTASKYSLLKFTTGSSAQTVNKVLVKLYATYDNLSLDIYTDSSSKPGTSVGSFSRDTSFDSSEPTGSWYNGFVNGAGVTLDANTSYWLVINKNSHSSWRHIHKYNQPTSYTSGYSWTIDSNYKYEWNGSSWVYDDNVSWTHFKISNDPTAVDSTAPTVSSVSSDKAAGSYKAGEVIDIDVNFSESVTVSGTPQITLETGSTDQVVNYSSGSGTSTLTFNYTVQAGDTTADLDYTSTSALALNSGTIQDASGNNASLTLASPGASNSLGANEALVIDTTAPSISSGSTASVAENQTSAIDVNASDTNTITYSISGGDSSLFSINSSTGVVTFSSAPDYENPGDSDTNNTYTFTATATDVAGNADTQSVTITVTDVDDSAPSVTFSPLDSATNVAASANITITFSEAIRNTDDSALTNANVDGLITLKATNSSGADIDFNATIDSDKKVITIDPTNDFSLSQVVYVAIGTTVEDASDNAISASNATFTVTSISDSTPPTMTITATEVSDGGSSDNATLSLTFTSSEATTDFAVGDISVGNATLSNFSATSSTIYTATLTPSTEGAVTVDVAANGFTDAAGNGNTAATQFNWTYLSSPLNKTDVTTSVRAMSGLSLDTVQLNFDAVEHRIAWLNSRIGDTNLSHQGIRFNFNDPLVNELMNTAYVKPGKLSPTNELLKLVRNNKLDLNAMTEDTKSKIRAAALNEVARMRDDLMDAAFNTKAVDRALGDWSVWTEGRITLGKTFATSSTSSQESTTYNISLGFDRPTEDNHLVGVVIGLGKGEADTSNNSTIDSDTYSISGYGLIRDKSENVLAHAMVGYGRINLDKVRIDGSDTLSGSHAADQLFGSLVVKQKSMQAGNFSVSPYGKIYSSRTSYNGYSESGGASALTYGRQVIDSTVLSAGVDADYLMPIDNGNVRPFMKFEYGADVSGSSAVNMHYNNQTTNYQLTLDNKADSNWKFVVGADLYTKDEWDGSVSYERTEAVNAGYSDSIAAKLGLKF